MSDDAGLIMRNAFKLAERRGFPQFIGPERSSTPLNASPYSIALSEIRHGSALGHRRGLMALLIDCVDDLLTRNVEPVAALLGGSAIGPKADPSDLDCVIFYTATRDIVADFSWMADYQVRSKAAGLDMRMAPLDGDPLLLIRIVSFFSTLYIKNAGESSIVRGLVLVDCRN